MDTVSIDPLSLHSLLGSPNAPLLLDVRRDAAFQADDRMIVAGVRPAADLTEFAATHAAGRLVVTYCVHGHEVSQDAARRLREAGRDAGHLEGGIEAWKAAGLPTFRRRPEWRVPGGSRWITRARPKIDRIACPWLIRRFIDADARFLFVDPPQVPAVARESGGVPFDIEGVELSHEGERCSFDTMLKLFGLESEPSLARLALIVRGADTARPDIAPEAAGLHAVSLGLSALAGDDDHGMLRHGFIVYDALFAWLRFAAAERHNWPAKAA